ncbi:MAG: hypothetical protein ACE37H_05045 [Phycisphaeraceae bacterium]
MNYPEIETAVNKAMRRMLERVHCGDGPPPHFHAKTKPIGDLGLDSMAGVGFLCELEDFGIVLADDLNPFVDDARRRARSIAEMIEFIAANAKAEEATV